MPSKLIKDIYFRSSETSAPTERHSHNVYQLIFIKNGAITLEIAGKRIECRAPSLVFIGNFEPHIISVTDEPYERYVLTLDPYQANSKIKPSPLTSVFYFHPTGFSHALDVTPIRDEINIMFESLIREVKSSEQKKLPEGEQILLSSLLYRIRQFSPSHFSARSYGAAEMTVASVRRELESNFASKLCLDSLAASHHISRYYLAHIFKEVTGYSLKEYLMLLRISYACRELAETSRPVGDIAAASGFGDMSNFSRAFKDMIGISPSEFRKKTVG